MTDLDGRLQDFEHRLRAAEDRLELLSLEGLYGYAYDSRQGRLWASLFTEDGVYQGRRWATVPARKQSLIKGRANLANFCEQDTNSCVHYVHMPSFRIEGTKATGRVHFEILTSTRDEYDRIQTWAVSGYYDVSYLRQEDGWRIHRRVTTYMVAKQSTHYGYERREVGVLDPSVEDTFGKQNPINHS